MTVPAVHRWPSNAHLIEDVATLGYLRKEWRTLDPTWGRGVFWQRWRPDVLTGSDLIPEKSPLGHSVDFTDLPWAARYFDSVVFDGPYKFNGTPEEKTDERYGVHEVTRWQDRMELLRLGALECARVLGDGYLLVKCMDQVVSGEVRWQTRIITDALEREGGLTFIDRFDFIGGRAQPADRRQVHAWHNSSQLLVFRRGRTLK